MRSTVATRERHDAPSRCTVCDSFGTLVYEAYGVKQAQERLARSDPAIALRSCVRPTAARAKAVARLDEVTRAALEAAQARTIDGAASEGGQRGCARRQADSPSRLTPLRHPILRGCSAP
jgi:hypothetical protein